MSSLKLVETGMFPNVPSNNTMFMLEAMTYKVKLRASSLAELDPCDLIVEVWTNQFDQENGEGQWHAAPLKLLKVEDGNVTYGASIFVTSNADFEFTFRAKRPGDGEEYTWFGGHGSNGCVHVEPPRPGDAWTQGPSYDHMLHSVYCGNFITATKAKKHGFTHVLNVADNLDMIYATDSDSDSEKDETPVVYKRVPMMDGGHNPIPAHLMSEAVAWLQEQNAPDRKILVHCRAGIGRAGSTVLGYVFATNTSWSYELCKEYVSNRRYIYAHKGLKEVLLQLYPRSE